MAGIHFPRFRETRRRERENKGGTARNPISPHLFPPGQGSTTRVPASSLEIHRNAIELQEPGMSPAWGRLVGNREGHFPPPSRKKFTILPGILSGLDTGLPPSYSLLLHNVIEYPTLISAGEIPKYCGTYFASLWSQANLYEVAIGPGAGVPEEEGRQTGR